MDCINHQIDDRLIGFAAGRGEPSVGGSKWGCPFGHRAKPEKKKQRAVGERWKVEREAVPPPRLSQAA